MRIPGLILIGALVFQACNIINPKEQIPGYVYVNSYKFKTDTLNHGTGVQKFTDVWITAGGDNLGGYEMPATVPVLKKGLTDIKISAGIKDNGLSNARSIYPFIATYDTMVNLGEKMSDTLHPVFNYIASTKFTWIENFNGTNPSVAPSPNSSVPVHITYAKDSAFEGGSLKAVFTKDSTQVFESRSIDIYTLPLGQAVYLELNYYTDVPLTIGLYAFNTQQITKIDIGGLNPINHWNKAYIDLGPTISAQPDGTTYAVYFNATNSGSDKGKVIMLDNIKLLNLE
jgi:hypothetical protein